MIKRALPIHIRVAPHILNFVDMPVLELDLLTSLRTGFWEA